MKPSQGKLPLSIIAIILCTFAFVGVLYKEDTVALSSTSLLKLSPCSRQNSVYNSRGSAQGMLSDFLPHCNGEV